MQKQQGSLTSHMLLLLSADRVNSLAIFIHLQLLFKLMSHFCIAYTHLLDNVVIKCLLLYW